MSEYLILEQLVSNTADSNDKKGPHWREVGTRQGPSAEAAVRAYILSMNAKGGVFLAIPERSAKTIRVKVETVQKVSVDAGDAE